MITTAIIAEYNPFHNGHAYQIHQARQLTNADAVIVIMSGNYTQRGEPALLDKYTRTQMALYGGADLVIELPVCYATGSAEFFAKGAVSLLNQLGIVDYLCFGSECGNVDALSQIALVLANEPEEYRRLLKHSLKSGDAYPVARQKALQAYLSHSACAVSSQIDFSLLAAPNNILGIEYCKALILSQSSIKPVTIRRIGNEYHDITLSDAASLTGNVHYSSASAIRSVLSSKRKPHLSQLAEHVPAFSLSLLNDAITHSRTVSTDDFSDALHYKLLLDARSQQNTPYSQYLDISEDFSDKLVKNLYNFKSFTSFCELLKTKDLTYTRISRNLLHILLGITKTDMEQFCAKDYVCYARILGLCKSKPMLTSILKSNSALPLITQPVKADRLLCNNGRRLFHLDLFASHLYESIVAKNSNAPMQNEFQRQLITDMNQISSE